MRRVVPLLPILSSPAWALACGEAPRRVPCGPDEVRIAERCVPAPETPGLPDGGQPGGSPDVDATDPTTASDIAAAGDGAEPGDGDALEDADGSPSPGLPFRVDERYVMSGFMGSGEVLAAPCGDATPADSGPGSCLAITWRPATATSADWTGFYFQYPENNWGDLPGFAIPQGATAVTFRAWGQRGGESANFATGLKDADGFQRETGYLALGASPSSYAIPLDGVSYTDVAGAFAWFLDNPLGASEVTFYLDDVAWVDGGPSRCEGATCKTEITFEVDMRCPDPDVSFESVWVTGPFCQWCAEGFELTDPDEDMVYTGTFAFARGPLEFKFMTNRFASQEDLVDDVAAPGSCAPVTDGSTYANRRVTVSDEPLTLRAAYGRCGACQ